MIEAYGERDAVRRLQIAVEELQDTAAARLARARVPGYEREGDDEDDDDA